MNRSTVHGIGVRVAAPRPSPLGCAASAHGLAPLLAVLLVATTTPSDAAPTFAFSNSPLFLQTSINPNVLVMFDNSQSMDATMAGKIILGSDPASRSTIARDVLRNVITTYRRSFNWGLGSFEYAGTPDLNKTWTYYMGDPSTVVYTNTCDNIVDGVGVSDKTGKYTKVINGMPSEVTGNLPCVASPVNQYSKKSANGFLYLTYARSSDDADVNDVYYQIPTNETEIYGIPGVGMNYRYYTNRLSNTTGWQESDFSTCENRRGSYPLCIDEPGGKTDAGFVPDASKYPRLFMLPRGVGYNNNITGAGKINEAIVSSQPSTAVQAAAEDAHFTKLMDLLATENTNNELSTEIKNAAKLTPLAGALKKSREYFSSASTTPVTASCQRNYVVLATDGNPTGKIDGKTYDALQRTNTRDPVTGLWTFGVAVNDVLAEVKNLKDLSLTSSVYGTNSYGVPTYVIGMGDSVINPSSVAALNEMAKQGGTDAAYLASSSAALNAAFQAIASRIREGDAAASSVTLDSGTYHSNSTLYQARFNGATWTGDLSAFAIAATGVPVTTSTWQASAKISAQDWNSGRVVLTYKPATETTSSAGVAFRWPVNPTAPGPGELAASQVNALNTDASGISDGLGAARLAYLRGDTSREARKCAACAPQFRNRTTAVNGTTGNVLGDIINSAPLYVGPPSVGHDDTLETVSYSAFAKSHATRRPYLYVGANDGMLHAIDASTGEEKFAYVPNLVFSSLSKQTATPYTHQYTVDGSPVVGDVLYNGAWHSLLVSGLRAGGRGLFALDVTDPSGVTEATPTSVVRWEVSDPDLGHVFAQPAIVKTNNGRWSVIVGNGYNAATPTAQLFVIDAESGAVTKLDTGRGSAGSPNGLSGAAPVDVDDDGIVDVVYAGDLDGNLWKFDLKAASAGSWSVALGGEPLFAAGPTKSITVRPDVTVHPKGGFMVTFATGRYLALGDAASTDTQTAYGIWDKAASSTGVAASQLQQQVIQVGTVSSNGDDYRFSTHRVGVARDTLLADDTPTTTLAAFYADKRGWYLDLPTSGERVVADPTLRGGRAIFTSVIPTVSASCVPGGTGWILEVDAFTGNRLGTATFNTNNDAVVDDSDFLKADSSASGPTNTTGWRIGAVPTAPRFLRLGQTGTETSEIKFVNTSDATISRKLEGSGTSGQRRVMWRVVQ